MQTTTEQPVNAPIVHGPDGMFIPPLNTRMRRVVDRARHLANDPSPMLLRGEFGVGKRVLASLVHRWGPRAKSAVILVRADCTDPLRLQPGMLVLEEIGELTLTRQKEVLALLAPNDVAVVPPKIVATTSQDLSEVAEKGQFSKELLSFLMDGALHLPPLRERPEDVTAMADQLLAFFSRLYHRPALTLESEARQALLHYAWPGNVHELRNTMEHVVLTATRPEVGEAELRLPQATDASGGPSGAYLSLDAMEKQHILRVMRATSTLEEAARILRVDITTLWRKRRRYGV